MTVSVDLKTLGDNVRLKPAYDVSFDDLADLFTRSYSNYFVPMKMSADMLSWIVNTQTIDLAASQVIEVDGRNIAFIFISARGLSQRVAAMGVIPEFRGRKLGQFLVEHCIQRAKEIGVHRMVLEVIDKNEYAISIYRKLGFEISRRLVGYRRPADTNLVETDDEPHEIDPREVAKSLIHEGPRGLPWQIAPEVLFALRPPARAFTLERSAYAVLAGITDSTVRLDTILVPRAKRRNA
ncbi:MAG: GNAT family N-acetyltransferase [Chloroflexota bacterium]